MHSLDMAYWVVNEPRLGSNVPIRNKRYTLDELGNPGFYIQCVIFFVLSLNSNLLSVYTIIATSSGLLFLFLTSVIGILEG